MVHPGTRNDVPAGLIAMEDVIVEYHGRASHASSKPEDGINALDALVIAYAGIAALRQHVRADARIHGIITHGGSAPNVVPDYAAGRFYIRARDDAYLDALRERLLGCFRAGAEATGARMAYSFPTRRFSAMRNNETLVEVFRDNYRRLGREESPPDPNRRYGSSDMGNVSRVVPSLHPSVAIAPPDVPGHSIEFARAAGSPEGMDGLADAAKAMALTAADLLARPELLARAAAELAAGD
jgi:metal-dependent amidase/aminoacylase/carboxypeptidase family protein